MTKAIQFKQVFSTGFFTIRPKETRSPSGREKISVRKKIPMVRTIPPESCDKICGKLINNILRMKRLQPPEAPSSPGGCKK